MPIFLDAMQPLDSGLTPHNGIPRLTLPQLQRVDYYSFCYFVSFCWEISLYDSCFSDELIACRSNVIIFFHIFLTHPWFLMSCSLFEKKHLLFSYDSPYTHFVQCVEYNNNEQHECSKPSRLKCSGFDLRDTH
jgi:hypothetical protein